MSRIRILALLATALVLHSGDLASAQEATPRKPIRERYTKKEVRIQMRDGAKLFSVIYSPKDTSTTYPILMMRTPYSVGPYGEDKFRDGIGPNRYFDDQGYIFVYQDVRGCYMSEGKFVNMTPHLDAKHSKSNIDESTDTYDTVEWLIHNVPNNNGKVGQWGISYPGFYCSAGMIDHHPALQAVSPQAPIADWWFDDFHHHGAFFLPHAFNFLAVFGPPRPEPTTKRNTRFHHGTPDGYQFFLDLGPLKNANEKHFKHQIAFWDEMLEHPNYDAFWQARNLLPHLKNVAPAVMTVGGWFDAEDLYGALNTYQAIEKQNPGIFNVIVMGPWQHGGWSRSSGERLGNISFGGKTGPYYQKDLELAFFDRFLKGKETAAISEATMFETGSNQWRHFEHWPPKGLEPKVLYAREGGQLSFAKPDEAAAFDEYISDPNKPVPFTEAIATGMTVEYMTDDQRFASRRPDVAAYQTEILNQDLVVAGPIQADLWVSTSGTDSDWIVKLIDVFPGEAKDYSNMESRRHLGDYQMMVRSEVIRGRFRNSDEHPEPFVPGQPTKVPLVLQDVLHNFQKGHRLMIQVQSTWFPLVDRNPQKYVDNIYLADAKDFTRATQHVYRDKQHPTAFQIGVLASDRR